MNKVLEEYSLWIYQGGWTLLGAPESPSQLVSYLWSQINWYSPLLWLSVVLVSLALVICLRRETPVIYSRKDCYPNSFILPYLTCLQSYVPTPWLLNRHSETIVPLMIRPRMNDIRIREETILVKALQPYLDDGQVTLQWTAEPALSKSNPRLSPIVLICPGLTGGLRAAYMRRIVRRIVNEGWQAVVFNPRGSGPSKLVSPTAYSAGFTDDLRQVVRLVKKRHPQRPLFSLGYSLGSNYLCKYVGEEGDRCLLSGAVCIAALTDLSACAHHYERSLIGRLYNAALTKALVMRVLRRIMHWFDDDSDDYNNESEKKKNELKSNEEEETGDSSQTVRLLKNNNRGTRVSPPKRLLYDRQSISHPFKMNSEIRLKGVIDSGYNSDDSSGFSSSSSPLSSSEMLSAFELGGPDIGSKPTIATATSNEPFGLLTHRMESDLDQGVLAADERSISPGRRSSGIITQFDFPNVKKNELNHTIVEEKKMKTNNMSSMKPAALYRESSHSALLTNDINESGKVQSVWQPYKAQRSRTLRDFDMYMTSQTFGYRCASEYYAKNSAVLFLQDISVPTLTINAKNDPLVPHSVIQPDAYFANPFLTGVLTRFGAHSMDWLTGWDGGQSWSAELIIQYLRAVLMVETRARDIA